MEIRKGHGYHLLDVFTDRVFGGNPLAVFTEAATIPPADMPRIARELNLSETVFVLPPTVPGADVRLRIFTPGAELPFAGHPTIGTACLLASLGRVAVHGDSGDVVCQEGAGNVAVHVRREPAGWFARLSAARAPEFREAELDRTTLATLLSLDVRDLCDDPVHTPAAASCGVPFLFVPLRDRAALARARLDLATWERHTAQSWAPHVFVYCRDPQLEGSHLRGRMFAPALGIPEDPGTGGAATALAALLASRAATDGSYAWRLEQGFEMGRPSILELEADVARGAVVAARVGGTAVLVGEGRLRAVEE